MPREIQLRYGTPMPVSWFP